MHTYGKTAAALGTYRILETFRNDYDGNSTLIGYSIQDLKGDEIVGFFYLLDHASEELERRHSHLQLRGIRVHLPKYTSPSVTWEKRRKLVSPRAG